MAYIHEHSCDCAKTELDLFSVPPTQTSIESSTFAEYRPISILTDTGPIEFVVPGGGEEYIDLASISIDVTCSIVRGDNGAVVVDTDEVGPVNLTLQSLFSEVDVVMKDTHVATNNDTNPYKAYIMTLLSYGTDSKESQLYCSGYSKDTAGAFNDRSHLTDVAGGNKGLKHRRALFANGTTELHGRIFCDLFMQERLMLDGVPIKIKLQRSKDAFSLMSSNDQANRLYKIKIVGCKLIVRKVRLNPSVYIAHMKTLETGNAKFPIRRVVCKSNTIPLGALNTTMETLFTGQLPSRIILGLVRNDAYNGSYGHNPFNFEHFNVKEVKIIKDGQSQIVKPIMVDFTVGQYMDGYLSLFRASGKLYKDCGLDITLREYASGYALYAFDLSPDMNEDCNFNLIREGSLRVDISFATNTPVTLNLISYAEFENIIEVDRNRNVILDY